MSGAALAQKAPSQAAAQALFEEGRKLMTAGKYSDACPKLAESQKLDPGAGTLINLAACYDKNGQTASAWATYKEAVSESEKSNRPEWAAKARQRASALEPTLAKLVVVVPDSSRIAGLAVRRDGADVGSSEWGLAIPVDPGQHQIEATAPGRKPWKTTVQVGKTREAIPVTVPALEPNPEATKPTTQEPPARTVVAPPPPPAEDAAVGSGQRTVGLVIAGVGVVGLGVGAVFGLQAMGSKGDAKDRGCASDLVTCPTQEGLDAVDSARSRATISTIGIIAGGVLVVGGGVLFLTSPKARSSTAATRGVTTWRVGSVGSGMGFSLGGVL